MRFHGHLALALPHLIAGLIALGAGAIALSVVKGQRTHRKSGMVFVYAMLLLTGSGILMAALKVQKLNLLGSLLSFYMVTTAVITLRRDVEHLRRVNIAALMLALAVAVLGFTFGIEAMNSPTGRIDGLPPAPAFMFGSIAVIAAIGDTRLLLRGIEGRRRISRHLWRMCWALFSATSSFFPAQLPKLLPSVRHAAWLWLPSVLVLLVMLFWLWRVRFGRATVH